MPVVVRHVWTNFTACSVSLTQSAADQEPPPLGPQKWPLKCVPTSCPSFQARPSCSIVSCTSLASRKPMSLWPTALFGPWYSARWLAGST